MGVYQRLPSRSSERGWCTADRGGSITVQPAVCSCCGRCGRGFASSYYGLLLRPHLSACAYSLSLQRFLQRLIGCVPAVGEEAFRVLECDRIQCPPHRLYKRLLSARLLPPQQRLELAEGLLDRREIRGVRRQEQELCAPPLLDQSAHPLALVRPKVVSSTTTTCRGRREGASTCSMCTSRRPPSSWSLPLQHTVPFPRSSGSQGGSRSWRGSSAPSPVGPLPLGRPSAQRHQSDVRSALVHEHEPPRVKPPYDALPPAGPGSLVALGGCHRLCL